MNQVLSSGISETGGDFQAVDTPVTFKCLLPCTLEIEQSIQVNDGDSTVNWWSGVVQVDGSYLPYSPYIGETPSDGSYVVGTVNQSTWLAPGTHTVQSFVYSLDGLTVEDYHMNYRVYVP
jgi:hypothetical protein